MAFSVPSALSSARALLTGRDEVGALPRGDDLLRDVTGLGRDLDRGVARGLLVVQDGKVVVDGGVDALLLQQGDGLGEALDGLDVRAGVLGDLGPVARQALCRLLALEVGERGDRGVVRPRRDDALGDRVGVGEAVQARALGVAGHLVGDHVEPLGRQAGEDRVPGRLDVLDLHAELLRDSGGDLDVVADERVGLRVVVAERGVGALGADLEDPGLLHPREVGRRVGAATPAGREQDRDRSHQSRQREPRAHVVRPRPSVFRVIRVMAVGARRRAHWIIISR